MIVVLAFLLGIANAVDMPVRQSFAVELVGREDIGNAVALNSAMFNGARVIGPAAAGLAIGAFGVGPAFAINALSFLAVIVGLRMMDEHDLHLAPRIARPDSARAVVQNLAEGLSYVRRTPVVLLAVVVVGTVATVGMNFTVLIPAFAQHELGSDATGYGFLMAASGVGSLLAALRLVFGGRPRPIRLAIGALILGVASVALAAARLPALARADGGGRLRLDPDGGHRQHDDPAGRPGPPPRPGDERLHDGLQRVGPDRRPGDGRRGVGFGACPVAIAIGGVLTPWLVGLGALAWGRQGAFDARAGCGPLARATDRDRSRSPGPSAGHGGSCPTGIPD